VGAAILPEILNLVLRAELRLDDVRWVSLREPAHHHATPPPCNRSSLSRSGLWGPELLHSLIGIRLPVSSELTRTSCPGYGCARSFGIHAYRHAAGIRSPRRVSHLDTWSMSERAMNTCGVVLGSRGSLGPDARASPPLAGTRYRSV